MGFKISWIAVEGLAKAQLSSALGFFDTDVEDEANESPFSGADLGNGWSLIWSNNVEWVDEELFGRFPPNARVVAVRLHEGVMYSEAFGTHDTNGEWRVEHDAQEGLTHLVVQGTPPNLKEVQDRLVAEQDADTSGQVDYIFDIPVEIAASVTDFRHDSWEMPSGSRPRFTVLSTA